MKYIRTKDGEVLKVIREDYGWEIPVYYDNDFGEKYVQEDDVVKQADTIEALCDCFIVDRGDGFDPYYVKPTALKAMDTNEPMPEIYGAIWFRGQDGLPTLKPVARMLNWKGDLELL